MFEFKLAFHQETYSFYSSQNNCSVHPLENQYNECLLNSFFLFSIREGNSSRMPRRCATFMGFFLSSIPHDDAMRKGDFFISDQMSLASAHLMSLT